MKNISGIKFGVFNIMAIVLGGLRFADENPSQQQTQTGTGTGTATAARGQDAFTKWWGEISGGGRSLAPGIYDIVPDNNPSYVGTFGEEGLEEAKEFIAENPQYVCSMPKVKENGLYILLATRPEAFQGEMHGEPSGLLFLDQVGDAVLIIPASVTA